MKLFATNLTVFLHIVSQEIFDEVTEDQLLPVWSYELAAVLEVLSVLLVQGAEVGVLEEKIAEVNL